MSLLKTIKQQLGLSGTPANNFTLDASADNGTMKLARGNAGATTQDIITVDAAGKVAFPQMEQLLSENGYIKLPGGLIVQWGVSGNAVAPRTINFPIPFPNSLFAVQATPVQAATPSAGTLVCASTSGHSVNGFTGAVWATSGAIAFSSAPFSWIAIGY